MSVKLSNAAVQSWLDNSTTVGFAKHVSGLSYDLPGFVVVAFTDERAATPPAGSPYYDDEIVVISPGTSPATRSTVRYTRTHTANETSITNKCLTSNVNCSGNPGACSPPDICVDSNLIYRCEAHAVLSPDASKIAFSSCWTGHCTAGNCGTLDNPQDYITFTRYHDWDGAPTPTVIATPGMQ